MHKFVIAENYLKSSASPTPVPITVSDDPLDDMNFIATMNNFGNWQLL